MPSPSSPTTYLGFLDEVIKYALQTAQGQSVDHPAFSDGLATEICHLINTIKASQSNRCMSYLVLKTFGAVLTMLRYPTLGL